jgi:hypothetical protein
MLLRISGVATLSLLVSLSAAAAPTRCEEVLKKIGKDLADVTCFESTDLTTTNPLTTPANNSIAGLPAFAFTPITDRGVIAPSAAKRPPITKVVPGVQINGRIAADPTGQARFPVAAAQRLERPPRSSPAPPARAASSTAISHGATTSCRRDMRTRRRTRAC